MSDDLKTMEALARQLYTDHRKVLEFIMEHGASTDFAMAAHSLFGENPAPFTPVTIDGEAYVSFGFSSSVVSFLPASWYDALKPGLPWEGCENWWAGLPLITWFSLSKNASEGGGKLRLYAEVGSLTNHGLRTRFIDTIENLKDEKRELDIQFQKGARDEGRKYSRFLRSGAKGVDIKDTNDSEEIAAAMKKLLGRCKDEFSAIGTAVQGLALHQQ